MLGRPLGQLTCSVHHLTEILQHPPGLPAIALSADVHDLQRMNHVPAVAILWLLRGFREIRFEYIAKKSGTDVNEFE